MQWQTYTAHYYLVNLLSASLHFPVAQTEQTPLAVPPSVSPPPTSFSAAGAHIAVTPQWLKTRITKHGRLANC
jgi:hypothetical protein